MRAPRGLLKGLFGILSEPLRGSGAFMWVVVFFVSMAVQRAAAAKIWVHGTSCRPPRGTQLELAADLGLILTAIGAI